MPPSSSPDDRWKAATAVANSAVSQRSTRIRAGPSNRLSHSREDGACVAARSMCEARPRHPHRRLRTAPRSADASGVVQVRRVPARQLHRVAGREGDSRRVVVHAVQVDQHPERPGRQAGVGIGRAAATPVDQRQHAGRRLSGLRLEHLQRRRGRILGRVAVLPEDHRNQREDGQQDRHRAHREDVQRARGQARVGLRLQKRQGALHRGAAPAWRASTIDSAALKGPSVHGPPFPRVVRQARAARAEPGRGLPHRREWLQSAGWRSR